jgi:lactoylglutathione lyase
VHISEVKSLSRQSLAQEGDPMNFAFNHFNFNVLDLEKSLAWYKEALGLVPVRTNEQEDFTIVFLGDETTGFRLELTWLKDRKEPYNLGDLEYHLAMTASDYDEAYRKHKEMGCICFENEKMGIYFIQDPDGYWIEIVRDGSYMAERTR